MYGRIRVVEVFAPRRWGFVYAQSRDPFPAQKTTRQRLLGTKKMSSTKQNQNPLQTWSDRRDTAQLVWQILEQLPMGWQLITCSETSSIPCACPPQSAWAFLSRLLGEAEANRICPAGRPMAVDAFITELLRDHGGNISALTAISEAVEARLLEHRQALREIEVATASRLVASGGLGG